MTPPLTLHCAASRSLLWGLLGLHVLAGASLFQAELPAWTRWAGLPALAASAAYYLRRRGTTVMRLEPDGSLLVRSDRDEWQAAIVLPQTSVSPWLSVLRYRLEGERWSRSLALLPDSLQTDDFRRLRVWLRWRATVGIRPEPAAAPSGTPPPGSPG